VAIRNFIENIKTGFTRSFWVANSLELFERLAFYGQQAVLAIFLNEYLKLSEVEAGTLIGTFGFAIYFLPVLAGTFADRYGFRKALAFAFAVLSIGYLSLGIIGVPEVHSSLQDGTLFWAVFFVLLFTAVGGSFIKPSVVGTVAKTSKEETKSLGYSIYYTIVNFGGATGPVIAYFIRDLIGVQYVFYVSALSTFLMFFGTLLFYKEPEGDGETEVTTIKDALSNLILVLKNLKFVLFLLIFSGFWMMFFQFYIALPMYLRKFVDPNAPVDLILSTGAATIIVFQVLVAYLTKKIPSLLAMVLGFVISSTSMLLLASFPVVWISVVALVLWALGEMTQAPRYYEYIGNLAPKGQEGLYMGYAFLPIAIGSLVAGPLGGKLVDYFGNQLQQPQWIWVVLAGIGYLAAFCLWLYHKFVVKESGH
jgi:MFS family permease